MRRILLKILQFKLKILARLILKKYHPDVIGVTGSVGKTSTTDAIYTVVSAAFSARKSFKNYNNELGVPLTIIGAHVNGKSLASWFGVFFQAFKLLLVRDVRYPRILVLEMGADRRGDINYLTNFIPLKIGVVTSVDLAHAEFLGDAKSIAEEKFDIIRALPSDGSAILNFDNEWVMGLSDQAPCKKITFGLSPQADYAASDISLQAITNVEQGVTFNLVVEQKTYPVVLSRIIAEHLVYSVVPAIIIGRLYAIEMQGIIERLKDFQAPAGRMRLIPGVKQTLLIDDTYNSSPLATKKALYQLNKINPSDGGRRIAVLGDMLELGSLSGPAHREVGRAVAEYNVDTLITVGEIARDIARGAIAAGFAPEQCFSFPASSDAGKFLQQRMQQGDVILIKGSQGMRMEKIVKEVMAEPQKAGELLVRQDSGWEKN